MGYLLLFLWVTITIISFAFNKDIFSPAKFYMLNIGAFFAMIFIKPYENYIYFYYVIFLIIGILVIIIEPKYKKVHNEKSYLGIKSNNLNLNKFIINLWLVSFIPIVAQLYMINDLGGFAGYLNSIPKRVIAWRGMGALLELIDLISVLNLFYFSLIIIAKRKNKIHWLLYFIHFSIFVIMALLSGSRGGLLWNIVYMLMMYHYTKKQINIFKVAFYAIILLLLASILGVVRTGFSFTSEGLITGLSLFNSNLELQQFEYGIQPIRAVYESNVNHLQYGLTFLSLLTNFIPRNIWPGKPDTGGVIITRTYLGDAWGGYSNISTGIIAEGVINFGKIIGPLIGLLIFMICMFTTLKYYRKILTMKVIKIKHIILLIIYIYVVTIIPGLVKGEWTATMQDLIIKVIKIIFVYYSTFVIPNKFIITKKEKG